MDGKKTKRVRDPIRERQMMKMTRRKKRNKMRMSKERKLKRERLTKRNQLEKLKQKVRIIEI